MKQRTFAMIKPTAVADGHTNAIIKRINDEGFIILDRKEITITQQYAEELYEIHRDKSFFAEMIDYITSAPVVIMVLEKENAIQSWRDVMGATNPADAAEGTLRKLYGLSIGENATHGSDSVGNAKTEIGIF